MRDFTLEGGIILMNAHSDGECRGDRCPLHRRTQHCMRSFPQQYLSKAMWRRCSHDMPHPDPDDIIGYWAGVACGCACKCCVPTPEWMASTILDAIDSDWDLSM